MVEESVDVEGYRTEPVGAWWNAPIWKKAALLLTLRPYCLARGYLAALKQLLALWSPNRPLHPMAWIHPAPCDDLAEYGDCRHDEYHPLVDKCLDGHEFQGPHFLSYERHLDVPLSFADNFDLKVGRMYRFVDLERIGD